MKKILMVCESFGGGVFTYVSQLCNDMCEDFEVYLAYSIRPQTPKNYIEFLNPIIHLIEMTNFRYYRNPLKIIKIINELRKIEEVVQPDLIHLHSSIAGGFGRIAFKGSKNNIVYTPHGYSFILMGKQGNIIYKLIETILGRTNNVTLTCCESENEVAKKLCKRTAYIETGINLDDLSKSLDCIRLTNNRKFTVFTLGRICIQKQPLIFNHIAEMVPEARFVWIGNGELENTLISPNIEVTGWKARKEALAIAKEADVYILCSLGEAVSMSLIENMFMKKLCLVSNVIGNKSVIQDRKNGYICNNVEEYVNKIKEAMMNFPYDVIENAHKDVLSVFNTKIMKKKYIKFYNDVIDGKYI